MPTCMDCKNELTETEYCHSLKDKVWKQANPKVKGVLCFRCIQKRLDRQFIPSDFYAPESFMKLKRKGII